MTLDPEVQSISIEVCMPLGVSQRGPRQEDRFWKEATNDQNVRCASSRLAHVIIGGDAPPGRGDNSTRAIVNPVAFFARGCGVREAWI